MSDLRYRRIDENGDYIYGNGQFDFLLDIDAFVQAVGTKTKLFQGEWWENLTVGMPYYQEILGRYLSTGQNDIGIITQIFLGKVASITGYNDTTSYTQNFDYDTREYSLSADISTQWGNETVTIGEL